MKTSHYLLFDRVSIRGANAVSSPLTYGFPSISGFLGAVHGLNRDLALKESKLLDDVAPGDITLGGVLIGCHECRVHSFRPYPRADYTFNLTRNPIKSNGKTASIVEEGRVDLVVSLLIEVVVNRAGSRWLPDNNTEFTELMMTRLMQRRIAGGSVFDIGSVRLFDGADEGAIKRALLPGFVLMDARDELIEITESLQKDNPDATALDALLDVATLHHLPPQISGDGAKEKKWRVRSSKSGRGWLVPMPVGFQGIAPAFERGKLANSRNPEYPSQYVESVYGLGKWVFPYRLGELSDCFWRYSSKPNMGGALQTSPDLDGDKPDENQNKNPGLFLMTQQRS